MAKNILLVGASGYIAQCVMDTLGKKAGYNFIKAQRIIKKEEGFTIDFSDPSSIEKFSLSEKTTLDGIFFMQGINPQKNIKEMTYEHFHSMMEVNLIGPALLLKKIYKKMNKGALVLFLSSVAAQKGSYDPAYASAKAGLTGLISSIANEFPDMRVNSISLGLVEGSPVEKKMTPDFRKKHTDNMFGNELIKVENIIQVIELLLTNNNISRANIPIDGGLRF
jgi:3-oxoacyl-[acyl-carrier protein] reductase